MSPAQEPAATFAALLRQLRMSAGLTQEGLAEAATLSTRSISDLERGVNLTARRDTARLLADALRLSGTARSQFEAAARGLAAPSSVSAGAEAGGSAAATRTLPRDTIAFTGRETELRQLLSAALGAAASGRMVTIHAVGGMAGVGKTTLAVHAAHRLAPDFPDGQLFLPLHAHTPGQQPVDPSSALASLLLTAGIAAGQIPQGLEERTRLWRDHVAGKRLLLVLDDAASHEQIRPILPGTGGSLVLVTSRRHLTALEDAHAVSLDSLPPGEAAELLVRLAARPELTGAEAAIADIARLCGYLPLAVAMLARQLHHHPAWTAADLAAELSSAQRRLELMQTENVSVSAAFDLSYRDLAPEQQRLFRRLGLHPGDDIDVYTAAALDDADPAAVRRRLDALYDHSLLIELSRGRYRLHDLMREHARTLASADPAADTDAAEGRLLDYCLQAAEAADRWLTAQPRPAPGRQDSVRQPTRAVPVLDGRADAMDWFERERHNLTAVASDAAQHDRPAEAIALAAALHAFLRQAGHWDQASALHVLALDCAVLAGDQRAEAGALANLGSIQVAMREYRMATESLSQAIELYREAGELAGEARALTDLAGVGYLTSDNHAAAANLDRALALYRGLGDRSGEALAASRLGSLQLATADYQAAAASLTAALGLFRELGDQLGEAVAVNELGAVAQATGDNRSALTCFRQARELYRSLGYRPGEANVLTDLAAVQQATGAYEAAVAGLTDALLLCDDLGDRLGKANALHQLGLAQHASGSAADAAVTQEEALRLYRELGDRAGEAETLSDLGTVELGWSDPATALRHFDQARSIAVEIESPVLEARALEGIGQCAIQAGSTDDGAAALQQALDIYQRIGSPAAGRVAGLLGVGQG
jgi:tetratricopeptide (TPR) repeat protein/transcriptional regulator with XRE-family HTH domain